MHATMQTIVLAYPQQCLYALLVPSELLYYSVGMPTKALPFHISKIEHDLNNNFAACGLHTLLY